MISKNYEEVWKRRTKGRPSQPNLYQKVVLVAGVLAIFLTVGLSLQWPPFLFLAAGVPGGTLLVFLLFKNFRPWNWGRNRAALQGTFFKGEEASQPEPVSARADRKMIAESLGVKSERTSSNTLQESIPSEPEEEVTIPKTLPVEREDSSPTEMFSGDGVLSQIQKRLATMEGKVSSLGSMLLSLEGKLAEMQETQLKSAPQIDLQAILTNLEKQNGKMEQ